MNAQESLTETVETIAQSLIEAPASHSVALANMGIGALTGSLVVQALAGVASILLIVNTVFMIRLNRLRFKNEKKTSKLILFALSLP